MNTLFYNILSFLPLLVGFLFSIVFRNRYLLTSYIFYLVLVLLMCKPTLVVELQKRPLYLQDVQFSFDDCLSQRKQMYYKWYQFCINVLTACLVAACMNYGLFVVEQEHIRSWIEVWGVFGGVLSCFSKIQTFTSRLLLQLCHLAQEYDAIHPKFVCMDPVYTHDMVHMV
jgi:hypothetical protein